MTSTPTIPISAERPAPPPAPVTWEEFLAWADEDTLAEWVNGEIVPMSPSTRDHQRLASFLFELIAWYVRAHRPGEVFFARVLMRQRPLPSVSEITRQTAP